MKKFKISTKALYNAKYWHVVDALSHKVYPVYLLPGFEDAGIITSAEAEYNGISTEGLELASLTDIIQIVESDSYTGVIGGRVQVKEGIFKFSFDTKGYESMSA